ncbi:MAG: GntR family transcriptional regulator [Dehalobacterium sp.]
MKEKKQIVEEVYEILKKRIINLNYIPGQLFYEADIANEFGLNKTQVKKIFKKLQDKKLINVIPRYGCQVAPIDFRYMKSVYEVLREIEGYTTRLAALRMPEEKISELTAIVERIKNYHMKTDYKAMMLDNKKFHTILLQSNGNSCFFDIFLDLYMHTERLWFYTQNNFTDISFFYDTLANTLEAIKERNALKAETCAKEHINGFVKLIKQELL